MKLSENSELAAGCRQNPQAGSLRYRSSAGILPAGSRSFPAPCSSFLNFQTNSNKPNRLKNKRLRPVAALLGLAVLLLALNSGFGGEIPATEYQVKAVFLFNFAKYVDWPAAAFTNTSAPITIGVLGEDRFDDSLRRTVAGKTVNGRPFVIRHIAVNESPDGCHLLFISDSEKKRLGEILGKIKARPVLTVGESGQFLEAGGVINFVIKEGRIRLEINLDAARQAGLQISSKLLNVADTVKGKLN
jgi:hypothetical protein